VRSEVSLSSAVSSTECRHTTAPRSVPSSAEGSIVPVPTVRNRKPPPSTAISPSSMKVVSPVIATWVSYDTCVGGPDSSPSSNVIVPGPDLTLKLGGSPSGGVARGSNLMSKVWCHIRTALS
jgi:hypothetical protein